MQITILGLGQMGRAFATRALERGHRVTVWNRSPGKAAQLVASGAVEAAALGGWSCVDPGPAQFDGSYTIEKLAVGTPENYIIYAEPLDGPLEPSDVPEATTALCRNALTDPGWPAQFACTSPPVATGFSTTTLSGP